MFAVGSKASRYWAETFFLTDAKAGYTRESTMGVVFNEYFKIAFDACAAACRVQDRGAAGSTCVIRTGRPKGSGNDCSRGPPPNRRSCASLDRDWFDSLAVLHVGRVGRTVYRKAYGNRMLGPRVRPARLGTLFDLASLTKPVACATAVMLLVERGQLSLADPVSVYIPEFSGGGREGVTVEQLLLHTSGLPAVNPLADYRDGPAAALGRIYRTPLDAMPGVRFQYSDLGYIVLGQVVAALAPRGLDRYVRDHICSPLRMVHTQFNPPSRVRRRRAPTTARAGQWIAGEVHDPRAYALGGVSGHAGLFGTANDLAAFCRMVLGGGVSQGVRVLADSSLTAITTPRLLPGNAGLRTYAFDVATRYSSAWAASFAPGEILGHTGFTGTMLCIHPRRNWFVVLLTNAIHALRGCQVADLRREILASVKELMDCRA